MARSVGAHYYRVVTVVRSELALVQQGLTRRLAAEPAGGEKFVLISSPADPPY